MLAGAIDRDKKVGGYTRLLRFCRARLRPSHSCTIIGRRSTAEGRSDRQFETGWHRWRALRPWHLLLPTTRRVPRSVPVRDWLSAARDALLRLTVHAAIKVPAASLLVPRNLRLIAPEGLPGFEARWLALPPVPQRGLTNPNVEFVKSKRSRSDHRFNVPKQTGHTCSRCWADEEIAGNWERSRDFWIVKKRKRQFYCHELSQDF